MRNLKTIVGSLIIAFVFASCSDDKEENVFIPVESKTVKNLEALAGGHGGNYTGDFAKFSFKAGGVVTGDNWDIAFRATQIIVNGGAKIGITDEPNRTENASLSLVSKTFSEVTEAPGDADFKQDANGVYALPTGSGNGWYTYTGPPSHQIVPTAGKILVVKTIDGNYAKLEITSYYKDNDSSNPANGRYFTFNYVFNPNVGDKSFQ